MKSKASKKTQISLIETTINQTQLSTGRARDNFKLPPLLGSNNGITQRIIDDPKSMEMRDLKRQLLNAIKTRSLDESLESLRHLIRETNQISVFKKGMQLLGDMYLSNREFANALYCYNVLRLLADCQENSRLKVDSLIEMSEVCKLLQEYTYSKRFLKKALNYIWLLQDVEAEANIYDHLGMLSFIGGDIEKANKFHDRATNFITESSDSVARKQGIESARMHLKRGQHKYQTVNPILLSKLGLIQENETEMRLHTVLEFHALLEQILQDSEFSVEINTPNRPKQKLTINGYLAEGANVPSEVREIHRRQEKRRFFEKKLPNLQLDPSVLKFSMEEQVKKRTELTPSANNVELFKKELQKYHTHKNFPTMLDRVHLGHLSPNRNLIGFKYCFKPMKKQILALFVELDVY